jgi:uncharacterized membrane protein
MPIWRIVAAALIVAGYAVLSHFLMARWPDEPWSAALLFGPLLLGLTVAGVLRRHWPTVVGCLALGAGLATAVTRGGLGVQPLYVLQHGAIHAVLGWTFGMTLRPGAKPLITMLAERVHERLVPGQREYTRRLTRAWTIFFVAMIVVSLVIYTTLSWEVWSVFCNLLTPLAAATFFAAEHVLRYRLHPEFERVSMSRALRAYRGAEPPR